MSETSELIEDFELETNPSQIQLAQLGVLRTFLESSTGIPVENDLFIFRGKGALGVNLGGRAIGIHENVLHVRFFEAMGTFTHEMAHNNPNANAHDEVFEKTENAIFSATSERLAAIGVKAAADEPLDTSESVLLDLVNQWDHLRSIPK